MPDTSSSVRLLFETSRLTSEGKYSSPFIVLTSLLCKVILLIDAPSASLSTPSPSLSAPSRIIRLNSGSGKLDSSITTSARAQAHSTASHTNTARNLDFIVQSSFHFAAKPPAEFLQQGERNILLQPLYTIGIKNASATSSAIALPSRISSSFNAKNGVTAGPRAVVMLPSVSTMCVPIRAPAKWDSSPG